MLLFSYEDPDPGCGQWQAALIGAGLLLLAGVPLVYVITR